MSARRDDLITRLVAAADPGKAPGQQDYMKSDMPYHGVVMPEIRRITKAIAKDHPFTSREEWESGVLEIWRGDTHLVSGELIYVNADPATKKSAPLPEPLRQKIIGYERVEPETVAAKS